MLLQGYRTGKDSSHNELTGVMVTIQGTEGGDAKENITEV